MKKVVSLLLVAAFAFVMGVGAFAAEDIAGYDSGTTLRESYNSLYDDEADVYDADYDARDYDTSNASPYNSRISVSSDGKTLNVDANEIILVEGTSSNKTIVMPETELEPGTEYTFNFYYVTAKGGADGIERDENLIVADTDDAKALPITGQILGDARLRLRNAKGTSVISSAKIEKKNSGTRATYNLVLTTKDNYGTKITDVSYDLDTNGTMGFVLDDEGKETDERWVLIAGDVSFQVGYQNVDDDEVDSYDEGDIITIYQDTPVFTKKQLDRIAKNYNYKAVEFEAEDAAWFYTGRVSGMSDTNFYWTHDVIPSIMNKLDQDFKFLTFPAGVTFPTNGEMRIDVSDVSSDWDRIYTYLYRNGSLTAVNTSYDAGADEIVFRTNYLGAFVMSDEEITDLSILDTGSNNEESSSSSENEESSTDENGGNNNGGNENPPMGTPASLNLVVGLGVVSLLTAGAAISRKRK